MRSARVKAPNPLRRLMPILHGRGRLWRKKAEGGGARAMLHRSHTQTCARARKERGARHKSCTGRGKSRHLATKKSTGK